MAPKRSRLSKKCHDFSSPHVNIKVKQNSGMRRKTIQNQKVLTKTSRLPIKIDLLDWSSFCCCVKFAAHVACFGINSVPGMTSQRVYAQVSLCTVFDMTGSKISHFYTAKA